MAPKPILYSCWMLHYVGSPFFRGIINLLIQFKRFFKWFRYTHIHLVPQQESLLNTISTLNNSTSCASNRQVLTKLGKTNGTQELTLINCDDIETVINRLGMGSLAEQSKGKHIGRGLLEVVTVLLETKEASMDELNGAFAVFDENQDGFVDAAELQRVMAMLGFKEGTELEDCEKMIGAFDENGDGRIDFREFKNILQDVK